MIVRQTRHYRLAELFFDEEAATPDVDVIEHFQRSRTLPGARCKDFYTLHVDLTQEQEALFASLSRSCRSQIRRAEHEDFHYETLAPAKPADVDEFAGFFDRFAAGKGLPPAPIDRLRALRDAGMLDLSAVVAEGQKLVWHAHVRAQGRARQLHSASLYRESEDSAARNRVGRAHRLLQWRDLVYYRGAGMRLYDFGGWYSGNEDEDLLRINAFKEEFGGHIVREFHCAVPITLRGRMILWTRRLRRR
jgi:hypothetical protein